MEAYYQIDHFIDAYRQDHPRYFAHYCCDFLLVFAVIHGFKLGLQEIVIDIFKMCALGALMNSIMLINILIMLYFEDRKGAVITGGIYFTFNVILTFALLPLGFDYYGFSYFLAGLAAYSWSGFRLLTFLKRIEVHTFISQSIIYKEVRGFFTRLSEKAYWRF